MKMIAGLGLAAALAASAAIGAGPGRAADTTATPPAADSAATPPAAAAPATPAPPPVTGEQAFNTECSACHMAYPPQMLPARSWAAITGDLANHFGEDASLDPATTETIAAYLAANAADATPRGARILQGVAPDETPLRITDMPWWRRIHSELPDAVFQRPDIKTRSNCLACHRSGGSGESGEGGERGETEVD